LADAFPNHGSTLPGCRRTKSFCGALQLPKADFAGDPIDGGAPVGETLASARGAGGVGFELLASPDADMQTVIVIIVARAHVEEFLSLLEGQGYLADRLELPFLDQLRATHVTESGAWIYPGVGGDKFSCLWPGGMMAPLRNLCLVHLPPDGRRGKLLQEAAHANDLGG